MPNQPPAAYVLATSARLQSSFALIEGTDTHPPALQKQSIFLRVIAHGLAAHVIVTEPIVIEQRNEVEEVEQWWNREH